MSRSKTSVYHSVVIAVLFAAVASVAAPRQMERLGRGVVAVNQGEGKAFVSWRLLGTEPEYIAFNIYRTTGNAQPVKLNGQPLTQATCYQDSAVDFSLPVSYTVGAVLNGREQPASAAFKFPANTPVRQYLSIPLQPGRGVPNDASTGDLNGDGEYEIVLKREDGSRDNSRGGATGSTTFESYTLDGTFMWKIDLGRNIRGGAHYTQFMVYDLDGDGKAEIVCKTADGTVDGTGTVIGDATKTWANDRGYILDGPEFLTVFDGMTGQALVTTDYVPPRGSVASWGDDYGNRVDRFLACIAYLDGVRPSVVMCRGYYTRTVLAAWDWRDGKLSQRWVFDSAVEGIGKDNKPNQDYAGQGNHNLSVADVDGDGKDEIIYGACCIDDDGKGLWTTGLRHGDAMHVSDLDPSRPGLEIFGIHEGGRTPGAALLDARTGEVIWTTPDADTGRGLAADVDPTHPGAECFGGPGGSRNVKGEAIQVRGGNNFAIWWDGDLLREILNRNTISKWNWETDEMDRIFTAEGCTSNNGSKATPALSADILGDWREELVERTNDNKELRIYTTVIKTKHRIHTLMHDPQYRESIAWQNVAYNQPPHPGFFLGYGMVSPPIPDIYLIGDGEAIAGVAAQK